MFCWACLLWHTTEETFPSHTVRCCMVLAPHSSCPTIGLRAPSLLRQHLLGGNATWRVLGSPSAFASPSSWGQRPACNYPSLRVTVDFSDLFPCATCIYSPPLSPRRSKLSGLWLKYFGCYIIQTLINPWRLTLLIGSEYTTDCCLNNSGDFSSRKFTCLHRSVGSHHV